MYTRWVYFHRPVTLTGSTKVARLRVFPWAFQPLSFTFVDEIGWVQKNEVPSLRVFEYLCFEICGFTTCGNIHLQQNGTHERYVFRLEEAIKSEWLILKPVTNPRVPTCPSQTYLPTDTVSGRVPAKWIYLHPAKTSPQRHLVRNA